jgi:hypothetical protein
MSRGSITWSSMLTRTMSSTFTTVLLFEYVNCPQESTRVRRYEMP